MKIMPESRLRRISTQHSFDRNPAAQEETFMGHLMPWVLDTLHTHSGEHAKSGASIKPHFYPFRAA